MTSQTSPDVARNDLPGSAPARPGPEAAAGAAEVLRALTSSIGRSVVGYEEVVRLLAISLVTEGHVLLEGAPGLAKTFLVRRFSESLSLQFKRIQFTPDMLPSDIVGSVVLNPRSQEFEFRRGPVFANVLLADEINRAPPKVQSALLEAMQERQVTIDGTAYPLPQPFIVIATQNPIEQEGTYPLPEAELDRLLFRILIGYPDPEEEKRIVARHSGGSGTAAPMAVVGAANLAALTGEALDTPLSPDVLAYLVAIVRATREDPRIMVGASPRAGVQFARAAKAGALFAGRRYVTPADVKSVAFGVLNHRVILHPELLAQQFAQGRSGVEPVLREVLGDLLARVAVPR